MNTNRPSGTERSSELAERVIRRDKWALRALMGLTGSLWLLAVSLAIAIYYSVLVWVMPRIVEAAEHSKQGADTPHAWEAIAYFFIRIGWPLAISSGILFLAAAASTILLVQRSRVATLRLVDHRLMQILAELRAGRV